MTQIAHLVGLADAYITATSIKEVTLSHRVFGDSKKLAAIRTGADITVSRFNSAMSWFSANWPDGVEWPSAIGRPMTPAIFDEFMTTPVAPTTGEAA